MTKRPHGRFTVFLDRDGVFNEDPHQAGRFPFHIRHPRHLHFLPGALEAFADLNRPDVQTALVTNQPFALTMLVGLKRVLDHLENEVALHGGRLDRIEVARAPFPHRRRKPGPGLLEDAATWFAEGGSPVDKERAVMIGDKVRDGEAALAYGVRAILLRTSSDVPKVEAWAATQGDRVLVVDDLRAAVDAVLAWL